jgi:hypothetical protein
MTRERAMLDNLIGPESDHGLCLLFTAVIGKLIMIYQVLSAVHSSYREMNYDIPNFVCCSQQL